MDDSTLDLLSRAAPVEYLSTDDRRRGPRPGMALCLSGGGYRAMLFHAGCLIRLNELGLLHQLRRISSVSGGSITAGLLGLKWNKLQFEEGVATRLFDEVVTPLHAMAGKTIDVPATLLGFCCSYAAGRYVAAAYRKHLFGDATLQDLPDDSEGPRFIINASNLQSAALWRFSKPYMRDYRVGEVKNPTLALATAVAASSAFPPLLSPVRLRLNDGDFTPSSGEDLQRTPFTTDVKLTDGGVYDNLGLETAWKNFDTIFVSDAGGLSSPEERPKVGWLRHTIRVLWLIDRQVRARRRVQVIESFKLHHEHNGTPHASSPVFQQLARKGAYWGIQTGIAEFHLNNSLPVPPERTRALADVPTRLRSLPAELRNQLINWGYAVCDAAVRRYYNQSLPAPSDFPLPGGVGI